MRTGWCFRDMTGNTSSLGFTVLRNKSSFEAFLPLLDSHPKTKLFKRIIVYIKSWQKKGHGINFTSPAFSLTYRSLVTTVKRYVTKYQWSLHQGPWLHLLFSSRKAHARWMWFLALLNIDNLGLLYLNHHLTLALASTWAPFCTRYRTTSVWPALAAMCSAVSPL